MDLMVLAAQRWVNETYKGKKGYEVVKETGKTGWPTMRSLIRALQIEEGIGEPNGSFGPTTTKLCPTVSASTKNQNLIKIVQSALYCKGYNPSAISGNYGPNTQEAVFKLQSDAGLPITDGVVTPMIFKALLSMDAYVLLSKGDPKIRTIQRGLNNKYYKTIGVMPCDGIYSRGTNTALIYGLQIEEGIAGANGHFGPGTSSHCPVLKQGDNSRFVTILKYALYCNNQDAQSFTTSFDAATKSAVYEFQKFSGLNATGVADLQTWKSLLVSTGDNMRKGTACDCSTPVTQARANTLKANGYKYIGRYIAGGAKKRISVPEIELILKNGMRWFPIFQKSGNSLNYFNYAQGKLDAQECFTNASLYRIPKNSTIYFSVDFDAMDGDITSNVLPYFEAINEMFKQSNPYNYKIGIYGSRNVCSRVSNAGYATKSFVSDMSTGFSGNLGFPLPKNWAFDQIREFNIGTGDGEIRIDNDIFSGRDMCINTLNDLTISKQLKKLFGIFSIEVEDPDLNYKQDIDMKNAIIQLQAGPKSVFGDGNLVITKDVKAGKFEMSIIDSLLSMFSWIPVTVAVKDYLGDAAALIGEGSISVGYTVGDYGLGLKAEVSQEIIKIPELAGIADQASVIYACCTIFPKGFDKELKEFFELLKKIPKILAGAAITVLVAFLVLSGAGLIGGASVGIAEFIGSLITAVSTMSLAM